MRLKFVDGSCLPFAVRELVDTVRHRTVLGLTCVFAILIALPGGGAFSPEVPLWARLLLNLISVGLFVLLFPALLEEAHQWATRRGLRSFPEPFVTMPTAAITTLTVEALAVFVVGGSDLTRWDLALKLAIGLMFWELHITMMLLFMGPGLRHKAASRANATANPARPQVKIGNTVFEAEQLRHIETDDHFLIVHTTEGTNRVLASMSDVQEPLAAFGMQVHRCHWVAFAELGGVTRNGRSYAMRTRSGHEVAVARERRKAVVEAIQSVVTP